MSKIILDSLNKLTNFTVKYINTSMLNVFDGEEFSIGARKDLQQKEFDIRIKGHLFTIASLDTETG